MITQRSYAKKIQISPVGYYIIRGVLGGILFGFFFNYERWNCLRPIEDLDEFYKTREPSIPEIYIANLSFPKRPISGEGGFLQTPWKILKMFDSDPNGKYFIVFLVNTSIRDVKRRFYARLSWASIAEIEGKRIGVIFVVQKGNNAAQDRLLSSENDLYGDILQVGSDVAEKSHDSVMILSGYQWCLENLGDRIDHFVNIRSNTFPSLPNLFEYISKMDESKSKDKIHCGHKIIFPEHKPRNQLSKFYVKRTAYGISHYPSRCESMAILSISTMKRLYRVATFTDLGPVPQGDVYVWGILREKLRAGGEKNLIDAREFAADDGMLPLTHPVDFTRSGVEKEIKIHWQKTKSQFHFENEEGKKGNIRHAKMADIPTTNDGKNPEKDMKYFVYLWRGH